MNKIGIIVPYRNREEHLKTFIPAIKSTLNNQNIDYEIIIVEQIDSKAFNRGKLLNIGVKRTIELKCNYIALHDVDMTPIDSDYKMVDRPIHMANEFVPNDTRVVADDYFGGVTLFPIDDFIKINGYSNKYWGWGFEDDDLLYRFRVNFEKHDTKKIKIPVSNAVGMDFNGIDSSIELPKNYKLKNYTILLSFKPNVIKCKKNSDFDEYSILTIPGYDTGFTYNSFKRFKFETWTSRKEVLSLNSDISDAEKVCLVVTVNQDDKIIKLYQGGNLVDESTYDGRLMRYSSKKNIFLGITKSLESQKINYSGNIDYVAIWNHSLESGQVKSISENIHMGFSENFEGYITSHCLEGCYDMKSSTNHKIFDLSGNNRHGIVHHCNRISIEQTAKHKEVIIPWRRNGKYKLLPHPENGYDGSKWTHPETRKNQLYFTDKVLSGTVDWRNDGLSNLRYKLIEQEYKNKVITLKVKL